MFSWLRWRKKVPESREVLLNEGLAFAMQWGANWLKPIQGRLQKRYPSLSPDELDEINAICQAAMKFGHGAVYEMAEKSGKDTKKENLRRLMLEVYPWVDEENLSQLFSQGMYYAWKDMGFA